jgi:hypothetical protein
MQRDTHSSLQIKALVDSKLLGDVLRGTFENYACDEGLGPDHWFWDRTPSCAALDEGETRALGRSRKTMGASHFE